MKKIDISKLNNFSRKGRDKVTKAAIGAGVVGSLYGAKKLNDYMDHKKQLEEASKLPFSMEGVTIANPNATVMDNVNAQGKELLNLVDSAKDRACDHGYIHNGDESVPVEFTDKKKLAKKVALGLAGVGALGLANGEIQTHKDYHNLMENIKDPKLKASIPSPTAMSIGALQEGIPYVPNSAKQKFYNTVDESLVNGGKGFIGKPLTYGKLAWNFHKWGRDSKDAVISGDISDAVEPTNIVDKYVVYPAYNIAEKISNSFNFSKNLSKSGSSKSKVLANKLVSNMGTLGTVSGIVGGASLATALATQGPAIIKNIGINKDLNKEKESLLSEVTPLRDIGRSPKLYNEFAERLANATTEEEKQKIYEEINNLPESEKELLLSRSVAIDPSIAYTNSESSSDYTLNNYSKKSKAEKVQTATAGLGLLATGLGTSSLLSKARLNQELIKDQTQNDISNLKNEKSEYDRLLNDRDAYNKALDERYNKEVEMLINKDNSIPSGKGYLINGIYGNSNYQDSLDRADYDRLEKAINENPDVNKVLDDYQKAEKAAYEAELNSIQNSPAFKQAYEKAMFSDPVVAYFYSEKKSSKEDKELKELQEAKAISDAKQMETIKENIENPKVLPNGKFTDDVIKKSNWKDTYKFGTALGAGMATGSAIVGGVAAAGAGLIAGLGAAALSFSENGEPVAEYSYDPNQYNFSDFHSTRRKAIAGTVAGLGTAAFVGKKLYDKYGVGLPEKEVVNDVSKEEQVEDAMHENDMMMATSMEFSDKFTKLFSEKNKSSLFEKLANGGLGSYIQDTRKNGKATVMNLGLKNNTYNKEKKK